MASIAINSGADDIDGTVGHEEIMHEAGSKTSIDTGAEELTQIIESTGSIAVKRNSIYSKFSLLESVGGSMFELLPVYGQT